MNKWTVTPQMPAVDPMMMRGPMRRMEQLLPAPQTVEADEMAVSDAGVLSFKSGGQLVAAFGVGGWASVVPFTEAPEAPQPGA